MKNKRGFTLVELLAVIAILAILVIIAMPNIMGLFKTAKKNTFFTQVKTIYNQSTEKYINEQLKGNKITGISSEDDTALDLSGSKISYCIKLDQLGNVAYIKVNDGTYEFESIKPISEFDISDVYETNQEFNCDLSISYGKSTCVEGGSSDLTSCVISSNYAETRDTEIETSTLNNISPQESYLYTTKEVTNSPLSTTAHFNVNVNFRLNQNYGRFDLLDSSGNNKAMMVTIKNNNDYVGYYTCGAYANAHANCNTLYKILETKYENGKSYITKYIRYDMKVEDVINADNMYKANDEYGESNYYRGNVKSNYLKFAGFYWRIVRINGDGSIRIIYAGKTNNATGDALYAGKSQFNTKNFDPTYVGYKYGENQKLHDNTNITSTTSKLSDTGKYYFASSYAFDETTKKFKLDGEFFYGDNWMNTTAINGILSKFPYTCASSSKTATCDFMTQLKSNVTSGGAPTNQFKAMYITYQSVNYDVIRNDTIDSKIKTFLDTWYENNILNKYDSTSASYSTYLADIPFCSDRTLTSGNGYNTATFATTTRINNKNPSLKCSDSRDKFSVANGKLKYPIGLLSADEAYLAGIVPYKSNYSNYLYTGSAWWTMSPAAQAMDYNQARNWYINNTGGLYPWASVASNYGVRPVINLSHSVKIIAGNGTSTDPYIVSKN